MSLLEKLEKKKIEQQVVSSTEIMDNTKKNNVPIIDEYSDLKEKIHTEIIEIINHEVANGNDITENQEDYILKSIEGLIESNAVGMTRADRLRIQREIYNNVIGLGPLEPLLADPDISEIMVNGPHNVYVERRGKLELSSTVFKDNNHLLNIINRIVSSVGRRIDETSPMVDARLIDGSRVNAVIPPVVLNGPTITIRKFSKNPLTVNDLIRNTSVSPMMMSFLEACVKGKLNIIVSGGTGSGKTTLLNILSGYIPYTDRIVTIEDAAELQLRQNHVVTMESRPANLEGAGQITIRELVRNALRMRPDRIVVGEVRSGETLDMLQAMNTGHDGSLTTAHANSPRDLMARLETMVLMSGMELPIKAIREQVSSALDIIVHQARLKDGSRRVVNITQVVGMEGDTITLQDLFIFKQQGLDSQGKISGKFISTGIRPTFMEKLVSNGVLVKDDWFKK
ncbi:CpaF family protein [Anaerovorax odorimutans]|uniref:CpaF family protein n=1 Tax=Anaerovorax odorimutans TaxID=109327 RepID=UPI000417A09C|nr:CpaF family protein [Anaerovorax odorimutans]